MANHENKDLLLAILALDAYNQGYNNGLDHGKSEIWTAAFNDEIALGVNDNIANENGLFKLVS